MRDNHIQEKCDITYHVAVADYTVMNNVKLLYFIVLHKWYSDFQAKRISSLQPCLDSVMKSEPMIAAKYFTNAGTFSCFGRYL